MPQSNEVPHKYCPLGVGHYGFRTHGVDEVRLGHLRLCQKRLWPRRLPNCLRRVQKRVPASVLRC